MAPRPNTYLLNGKNVTASELAEIRGCTTGNMRLLIRLHGYPGAMTVAARSAINGKPRKMTCDVKLKPFDATLEKKRRWVQWLRRGMTFEEIRIKERMI